MVHQIFICAAQHYYSDTSAAENHILGGVVVEFQMEWQSRIGRTCEHSTKLTLVSITLGLIFQSVVYFSNEARVMERQSIATTTVLGGGTIASTTTTTTTTLATIRALSGPVVGSPTIEAATTTLATTATHATTTSVATSTSATLALALLTGHVASLAAGGLVVKSLLAPTIQHSPIRDDPHYCVTHRLLSSNRHELLTSMAQGNFWIKLALNTFSSGRSTFLHQATVMRGSM